MIRAILAALTAALPSHGQYGHGVILFNGHGPEWWRWQYISARRHWPHVRARWSFPHRVVGDGMIAFYGHGAEWWHARLVKLQERRKRHAPNVVRIALRYVGVPYVWGGTTPRGFDCSGLVQYVFRTIGISLPRTTWGQMSVGRPVSRAGLHAGDVVFVYGGEHEGIYLGGGRFVDANHSGGSVGVRSLAMYPAYAGARRYG